MKQLFSTVLLVFTFFGHAPAQPLAGTSTTTFHAAARAARSDAGRSGVARVSAANKGVQFTPSTVSPAILVSKDIGAERWAIALNEEDELTGNVFRCDGGKVSFLWCPKIADDHNADFPNRVVVWNCYGADTCLETPCVPDDEWRLIAEGIQLTGSFFLP